MSNRDISMLLDSLSERIEQARESGDRDESPEVRADRIRDLIAKGYIEVCPGCGELSAYSYLDADECDDNGPESGQVATIGTCSSWEWECGHCRTHWMEHDSPLNSPCYTHSEDDSHD